MKYKKSDIVKWCAALDSGEYPQGIGQLQSHIGYCCLGVACSIFIPKEKQVLTPEHRLEGVLPCRQSQPDCPLWLVEISEDFLLKTGKDLWQLNDAVRLTFPEIATLLELVYIHQILD